MNLVHKRGLLPAILVLAFSTMAVAQPKGGPRLSFSVTSTAWPDGGEVPMRYSGRGENKSPAFEFHWNLGINPGSAPETLQTYAVIFHDLENSSNKTTVDTLHWSAFNIPGTAKGLPEGLGSGDLPDGTRNGPGISASRPGGTPGYFGPGAGPGPIHHYLFEFYALDTKLDLPANTMVGIKSACDALGIATVRQSSVTASIKLSTPGRESRSATPTARPLFWGHQ